MKWEVNGPRFNDCSEADALRVFEKNYLFTKDELITSLERNLEFLREEEGLTEKSRKEKLALFERFLAAIKKSKLPDLSPENWRCYEYGFVGDGIVLELVKVDEIEFENESDDLDSMTTSDFKVLIRIDSDNVDIEEFAAIQNVKTDTVARWIKKGKLKSAKLDGDKWLIPSAHDRPERDARPGHYLVEEGLQLEEFPFAQFSEDLYFLKEKDTKNYKCVFHNHAKGFHEEMVLTKQEVERLEYLLVASGKAKLSGFAQCMPVIK